MTYSGTFSSIQIAMSFTEIQYVQVMHRALHKGIKIQLHPLKFGLKIILIYLQSNTYLPYTFHFFFQNAMKRKELHSSKTNTFDLRINVLYHTFNEAATRLDE